MSPAPPLGPGEKTNQPGPQSGGPIQEPPPPADAVGGGDSGLARSLRHAEGLRTEPYADSGGELHIGYGHRLQITPEEAEDILRADIEAARQAAARTVGPDVFAGLGAARQDALAELVFSVGEGGFREFRGLLAALRAGNFSDAFREMRDSLWCDQLGPRCWRVAGQMLTGEHAFSPGGPR